MDAADRAPAPRGGRTRRACSTRWSRRRGSTAMPLAAEGADARGGVLGRGDARRAGRGVRPARVEDALPVRPVPVRRRLLARARDRRRAQPEDAAVSMHRHHLQLREFAYTGPWEHFFHVHGRRRRPRLVVRPRALARRRARGAWRRLLWVTFENLEDDLPRELARIAAFLGTRADGATLAAVAAASSFESMRGPLRRLEDQQLLQCARGHFRRGATAAGPTSSPSRSRSRSTSRSRAASPAAPRCSPSSATSSTRPSSSRALVAGPAGALGIRASSPRKAARSRASARALAALAAAQAACAPPSGSAASRAAPSSYIHCGGEFQSWRRSPARARARS